MRDPFPKYGGLSRRRYSLPQFTPTTPRFPTVRTGGTKTPTKQRSGRKYSYGAYGSYGQPSKYPRVGTSGYGTYLGTLLSRMNNPATMPIEQTGGYNPFMAPSYRNMTHAERYRGQLTPPYPAQQLTQYQYPQGKYPGHGTIPERDWGNWTGFPMYGPPQPNTGMMLGPGEGYAHLSLGDNSEGGYPQYPQYPQYPRVHYGGGTAKVIPRFSAPGQAQRVQIGRAPSTSGRGRALVSRPANWYQILTSWSNI